MKLLKEPLLHFLLLGGLLFAGAKWLGRAPESTGTPAVQVTEQDIQWLRETWTRQWLREPTPQEMRGLVRDLLKEELLAREAMELGLGENDTIIRRRLAQKLEFVLQDRNRAIEPSETQLQDYFAAHAAEFQGQPRISFEHVYFNRERHKDPASTAREARREILQGRKKPAGDSSLLNPEFDDVEKDAVVKQFGNEFGEKIFALPLNQWSEPIESAYGLHLVRVSALQPPAPVLFADVRGKVLDRWHDENQKQESEKYFAALLKKYGVDPSLL